MVATVVRDKSRRIHIRFSDKGVQDGGEVEIVDILYSKDGEPDEEFTERCERFAEEVRTRNDI